MTNITKEVCDVLDAYSAMIREAKPASDSESIVTDDTLMELGDQIDKLAQVFLYEKKGEK